ncbi:MAG: MBL fold metallo-hydrolase [Nitrospirota bacterium]
MDITIHRGTKEIGGTCIQLTSSGGSILLDIGQPLGKDSTVIDLSKLQFDSVLVSHPHQDHFGLIDSLDPSIPIYIGESGKDLIELTRVFLKREPLKNDFHHFEKWKPFDVCGFRVTPYLVDHSAVDAYAFLIEAEGKRVFYSGDFRAHGRKSILFDKMVSKPPVNIDALIMEGTMLDRSNDDFPDELSVGKKIEDTIRHFDGIAFLLASSQNIDRIVSAYNACLRTGRTFVIDLYTAWVLDRLKKISKSLPVMDWDNVKVYMIGGHYEALKANKGYFGEFTKRAFDHRVFDNELIESPSRYLYFGKMSSSKEIEMLKTHGRVSVIYSQWLGYLNRPEHQGYHSIKIAAYRDDPQVDFIYAHTSGHATVEDLKTFAAALKPKMLIPVHTEHAERYSDYFENVVMLNDGENMHF